MSIAGVLLLLASAAATLKALGLKLTTVEEKPTVAAPTNGHGDDSGPPRPRTADRVTALEVRSAAVEESVQTMSDRVGEMSLKQAVMAEKVGTLGDQVGRANSDNAARYDRLVDKLDDIKDAALRRGR